jgi:hypothetical protein
MDRSFTTGLVVSQLEDMSCFLWNPKVQFPDYETPSSTHDVLYFTVNDL